MKFLGRSCFDERTMTYLFADGTGAIPVEMQYDLFAAAENRNELGGNAIPVLSTLFSWQKRLTYKGRQLVAVCGE